MADLFYNLLRSIVWNWFAGCCVHRLFDKTMPTWVRWYTGFVSLAFIAPGLNTMIIGTILLVPIGFQQLLSRQTSSD